MGTEKRHFGALFTSRHTEPRRPPGRGLSLFAEQVTARDWGACVPSRPRTSLTASNDGAT